MLEKLVLRVVDLQVSSAGAAAAATWARIRRDVLPDAQPGWRITVPVRVRGLGPEAAEAFSGELLRLARLDAGAWSSRWAQLAFEVGGSRVVVYGTPLLPHE